MTDPVPGVDDPRQLLATTRDLANRVREEQRAAWFPLLVLSVVTLAVVPFNRYGHISAHCAFLHGGRNEVCAGYPTLAFWYWPLALLVAYVTIGWFYLRRSRRQGIGTGARLYAVVGVGFALLAVAWALWSVSHPGFLAGTLQLGASPPADDVARVASPAGAIGLALLLLARIERSWTLLAITIVYLVIVILAPAAPSHHGGVAPLHLPTHGSWRFLPQLLLDAGVLLAGGAVLALTQRSPGTRSTA